MESNSVAPSHLRRHRSRPQHRQRTGVSGSPSVLLPQEPVEMFSASPVDAISSLYVSPKEADFHTPTEAPEVSNQSHVPRVSPPRTSPGVGPVTSHSRSEDPHVSHLPAHRISRAAPVSPATPSIYASPPQTSLTLPPRVEPLPQAISGTNTLLSGSSLSLSSSPLVAVATALSTSSPSSKHSPPTHTASARPSPPYSTPSSPSFPLGSSSCPIAAPLSALARTCTTRAKRYVKTIPVIFASLLSSLVHTARAFPDFLKTLGRIIFLVLKFPLKLPRLVSAFFTEYRRQFRKISRALSAPTPAPAPSCSPSSLLLAALLRLAAQLHTHLRTHLLALPRTLTALLAGSSLARIPLLHFYAELWRLEPALLLRALATNYLLPVALDMAPWWLSQRALGQVLRDARADVEGQLMQGAMGTGTGTGLGASTGMGPSAGAGMGMGVGVGMAMSPSGDVKTGSGVRGMTDSAVVGRSSASLTHTPPAASTSTTMSGPAPSPFAMLRAQRNTVVLPSPAPTITEVVLARARTLAARTTTLAGKSATGAKTILSEILTRFPKLFSDAPGNVNLAVLLRRWERKSGLVAGGRALTVLAVILRSVVRMYLPILRLLSRLTSVPRAVTAHYLDKLASALPLPAVHALPVLVGRVVGVLRVVFAHSASLAHTLRQLLANTLAGVTTVTSMFGKIYSISGKFMTFSRKIVCFPLRLVLLPFSPVLTLLSLARASLLQPSLAAPLPLLLSHLALSLLYILIHTVETILRSQVDIQTRSLARTVMAKHMLHAPPGAVQRRFVRGYMPAGPPHVSPPLVSRAAHFSSASRTSAAPPARSLAPRPRLRSVPAPPTATPGAHAPDYVCALTVPEATATEASSPCPTDTVATPTTAGAVASTVTIASAGVAGVNDDPVPSPTRPHSPYSPHSPHPGALLLHPSSPLWRQVSAEEVEARVMADISESLSLINFHIPNLFRSLHGFLIAVLRVWRQRHVLDVLSFVRPLLVGSLNEALAHLRHKGLGEMQLMRAHTAHAAISAQLSDVVEGAAEIRAWGMSRAVLSRLHRTIQGDVGLRVGAHAYADRFLRNVYHRNLLDWVSEVWVMARVRGGSAGRLQEWRQARTELEYASGLGRRVVERVGGIGQVLEGQERVGVVLRNGERTEGRCVCGRAVCFEGDVAEAEGKQDDYQGGSKKEEMQGNALARGDASMAEIAGADATKGSTASSLSSFLSPSLPSPLAPSLFPVPLALCSSCLDIDAIEIKEVWVAYGSIGKQAARAAVEVCLEEEEREVFGDSAGAQRVDSGARLGKKENLENKQIPKNDVDALSPTDASLGLGLDVSSIVYRMSSESDSSDSESSVDGVLRELLRGTGGGARGSNSGSGSEGEYRERARLREGVREALRGKLPSTAAPTSSSGTTSPSHAHSRNRSHYSAHDRHGERAARHDSDSDADVRERLEEELERRIAARREREWVEEDGGRRRALLGEVEREEWDEWEEERREERERERQRRRRLFMGKKRERAPVYRDMQLPKLLSEWENRDEEEEEERRQRREEEEEFWEHKDVRKIFVRPMMENSGRKMSLSGESGHERHGSGGAARDNPGSRKADSTSTSENTASTEKSQETLETPSTDNASAQAKAGPGSRRGGNGNGRGGGGGGGRVFAGGGRRFGAISLWERVQAAAKAVVKGWRWLSVVADSHGAGVCESRTERSSNVDGGAGVGVDASILLRACVRALTLGGGCALHVSQSRDTAPRAGGVTHITHDTLDAQDADGIPDQQRDPNDALCVQRDALAVPSLPQHASDAGIADRDGHVHEATLQEVTGTALMTSLSHVPAHTSPSPSPDTPTTAAHTSPSPSPSASPAAPSTPIFPLLLRRGHSYALVGRNRSGKSTLVHALCKTLADVRGLLGYRAAHTVARAVNAVDAASARDVGSGVQQVPDVQWGGGVGSGSSGAGGACVASVGMDKGNGTDDVESAMTESNGDTTGGLSVDVGVGAGAGASGWGVVQCDDGDDDELDGVALVEVDVIVRACAAAPISVGAELPPSSLLSSTSPAPSAVTAAHPPSPACPSPPLLSVPLNVIPEHVWRAAVLLVSQRPYVFAGSVCDNVACAWAAAEAEAEGASIEGGVAGDAHGCEAGGEERGVGQERLSVREAVAWAVAMAGLGEGDGEDQEAEVLQVDAAVREEPEGEADAEARPSTRRLSACRRLCRCLRARACSCAVCARVCECVECCDIGSNGDNDGDGGGAGSGSGACVCTCTCDDEYVADEEVETGHERAEVSIEAEEEEEDAEEDRVLAGDACVCASTHGEIRACHADNCTYRNVNIPRVSVDSHVRKNVGAPPLSASASAAVAALPSPLAASAPAPPPAWAIIERVQWLMQDPLLRPSATSLVRARAVLDHPLEARATNISGGFAQSVALARALLRVDAQVWVLDEAMGQMDPVKSRRVLSRMMRIAKLCGITLIIISHQLQSVTPLVDEIWVMQHGKVVQRGQHTRLISEIGAYHELFTADSCV